jgi:hypothetical protein
MSVSKKYSAGDALLTLGLEFTAVGMFALLADTSDDMANIVMTFMIGLWLIWMISNAKTLQGLNNVISYLSGKG